MEEKRKMVPELVKFFQDTIDATEGAEVIKNVKRGSSDEVIEVHNYGVTGGDVDTSNVAGVVYGGMNNKRRVIDSNICTIGSRSQPDADADHTPKVVTGVAGGNIKDSTVAGEVHGGMGNDTTIEHSEIYSEGGFSGNASQNDGSGNGGLQIIKDSFIQISKSSDKDEDLPHDGRSMKTVKHEQKLSEDIQTILDRLTTLEENNEKANKELTMLLEKQEQKLHEDFQTILDRLTTLEENNEKANKELTMLLEKDQRVNDPTILTRLNDLEQNHIWDRNEVARLIEIQKQEKTDPVLLRRLQGQFESCEREQTSIWKQLGAAVGNVTKIRT